MRGLCLSVCRRCAGTVGLGCGMGIVLVVGIVGTVVVGFVVCPLCVWVVVLWFEVSDVCPCYALWVVVEEVVAQEYA